MPMLFTLLTLLAFQTGTPKSPSTLCAGDLAIPSCRSFQEMLHKKDRATTEALAPNQEAYACFDPRDDDFTLISFTALDRIDMIALANHAESISAQVRWSNYRNGLSIREQQWEGRWNQSNDGPILLAGTDPTGPEGMLVTAVEVSLEYSGQNNGGTTTKTQLFIRRSTLRFTERLTATGDPISIESTGRCLHFPPKSKPANTAAERK